MKFQCRVEGFTRPRIPLEQYITPPDIAARILFTIHTSYDDIEGKSILDLGCGTGMLTFGSLMLGSAANLAIDMDSDALNDFTSNGEALDILNCVEFLQADVTNLPIRGGRFVDTTIMNPPFGTKRNGADMLFLEKAAELSDVVYSLHKSTTRNHIMRKSKGWGLRGDVLYTIKFPLQRQFRYHKKEQKDTIVDLWRFECDAFMTDEWRHRTK